MYRIPLVPPHYPRPPIPLPAQSFVHPLSLHASLLLARSPVIPRVLMDWEESWLVRKARENVRQRKDITGWRRKDQNGPLEVKK